MKKVIGLVVIAAAMLVGCGEPEQQYVQVCKDKNGVVVATAHCTSSSANSGNFMLWYLLGQQNGRRMYYQPGYQIPSGSGWASRPQLTTRTPSVSEGDFRAPTMPSYRPFSGGKPSTSTSRPYSSPSRSYSTPSRPYSSPSRPSTSRPFRGGGFRGGRR